MTRSDTSRRASPAHDRANVPQNVIPLLLVALIVFVLAVLAAATL
ncbi:hypothetical protein J2752_001825 [Halarchaeum rubridurum]|uniref:Uncharacterized protein n=1 Tax=Halarchaeum rubridurum TaxID=489911 RepID=A0A8T4GRS1_9EURY|nr:hypothetical protein [Halarchaeum rubridurum]MBP1954913.1 hypothetical protein [Halarchaeum rubridurum]